MKVITRESGILNPRPASDQEVAELTYGYKVALGIATHGRFDRLATERRRIAREAALTDEPPALFAAYRARLPLTAHWAEDEGTTHKRAVAGNELHRTVHYYGGRTLLRFMKGTYADLGPDGDLSALLQIEVSRIKPEAKLEHMIKEATIKRPENYSQKLPFAHYATFIPVLPNTQVIQRKEGRLRVVNRHATGEMVLAHEGVVSLDPSRDLYWDTVWETDSTLMFGNNSARRVVDMLTGQPAPTDLFSSSHNMPDLSFMDDMEQPEPLKVTTQPTESIEDLLADMHQNYLA